MVMEDSYRTHTDSIWNQQTASSAFQASCNLKPVFPYRSFLAAFSEALDSCQYARPTQSP